MAASASLRVTSGMASQFSVVVSHPTGRTTDVVSQQVTDGGSWRCVTGLQGRSVRGTNVKHESSRRIGVVSKVGLQCGRPEGQRRDDSCHSRPSSRSFGRLRGRRFLTRPVCCDPGPMAETFSEPVYDTPRDSSSSSSSSYSSSSYSSTSQADQPAAASSPVSAPQTSPSALESHESPGGAWVAAEDQLPPPPNSTSNMEFQAFTQAGIEIVESLAVAEAEALKAIQGDSSPGVVIPEYTSSTWPAFQVGISTEQLHQSSKEQGSLGLDDMDLLQKGGSHPMADIGESGAEIVARAVISEVADRLPSDGAVPGDLASKLKFTEDKAGHANGAVLQHAHIAEADTQDKIATSADKDEAGLSETARTLADVAVFEELLKPRVDSRSETDRSGSSLTVEDVLSAVEVHTNGAVAAAPAVEASGKLLQKESTNGAVRAAPATATEAPRKVPKEMTMLDQMKRIMGFAGPALVIWLSSPLMSLIDTAVVGQGSSLELAALGPGTVVCDNISNLFMFLSVATSNLIATSMAHQDVEEAGRHLSRLLFVALACGMLMIAFTFNVAPIFIRSFAGSNVEVIPAANTYAFIRGLAWPAVLVMSVAQSASLGMQDAWGPLYVLITASLVNLVGDIILCPILGWGIAGAAWATMASQYVGCFLMLYAIHRAKSIKLAISVPSPRDLLLFLQLAAPILLIMLSKTAFYTLLTKVASSLGSVSMGAHQVVINLFALCAVCGEPLSQTAQSYMPALREGRDKDLKQARLLLKSLMTIGVIEGAVIGALTASIPWVCPGLFTKDAAIIDAMRRITLPLHMSLLLTPLVLSLEGTLLAGRDLRFLALSMMTSLGGCVVCVLAGQRLGLGLAANWWALVAFQSVRLLQAAIRLRSPKGVLHDPVESAQPEKRPLLA